MNEDFTAFDKSDFAVTASSSRSLSTRVRVGVKIHLMRQHARHERIWKPTGIINLTAMPSNPCPPLSLHAGSIIFKHEKHGLPTRVTLKATSQKEARKNISPGRGTFTDSSGVETSIAP
jgi:hypothetical protein